VKKYSNHIAFPIFLTYDKSEWNAEEKKSDKMRDDGAGERRERDVADGRRAS
jgi:HSP90 family molecular chaperone